jgi:hypothetical protein
MTDILITSQLETFCLHDGRSSGLSESITDLGQNLSPRGTENKPLQVRSVSQDADRYPTPDSQNTSLESSPNLSLENATTQEKRKDNSSPQDFEGNSQTEESEISFPGSSSANTTFADDGVSMNEHSAESIQSQSQDRSFTFDVSLDNSLQLSSLQHSQKNDASSSSHSLTERLLHGEKAAEEGEEGDGDFGNRPLSQELYVGEGDLLNPVKDARLPLSPLELPSHARNNEIDNRPFLPDASELLDGTPIRSPGAVDARPCGTPNLTFANRQPEEELAIVMNESSFEDGSDADLSVVKITSVDAKAAARAAAILKLVRIEMVPMLGCLTDERISQHDYDWLPTKKPQTVPSHDNSIVGSPCLNEVVSGVSGSAERKHKRKASRGGLVGDKVVIPGTPGMDLPELLEQAVEVCSKHQSVSGLSIDAPSRSASRQGSLCPVSRAPTPSTVDYDESGSRRWIRDDWKRLDACFTDERLELAANRGMGGGGLVDVDEVDLDNVVMRFIAMMGGSDTIDAYGSGWTLLVSSHSLTESYNDHSPRG